MSARTLRQVSGDRIAELARSHSKARYHGEITNVSGLLVECEGLPAAIGELVEIEIQRDQPILAEVVGFRRDATLLMPHGPSDGVAPLQHVQALGRPFELPVGDELLGRTLDGFGEPLDGLPKLSARRREPVQREAPTPLSRPTIDTPLTTGVRAIDGLLTLGRGQRLGLFAGSGVGKSTLLGQVARGTDADILVVALVGERGREVRDFLSDVLGEDGTRRAVTVVATSDRPPIERYSAPFVAMTVAEYFRDQGKNVLLVMDSVTRFAAACREIGLAAGEPPTLRGYPPRFFATIPRLVERMGNTEAGSITGLLTVLLDADDPNEPVGDTLRGLLDGHVFLDRELASRGHFPPIDVLSSLSRLMPALVDEDHAQLAALIRRDLAVWRDAKDLVEVGAYRPGANPELDAAIARLPLHEAFLTQARDESSSFPETVAALRANLGH